MIDTTAADLAAASEPQASSRPGIRVGIEIGTLFAFSSGTQLIASRAFGADIQRALATTYRAGLIVNVATAAVGAPIVLLFVLVLDLSVAWVYSVIVMDKFVKAIPFHRGMASGRWKQRLVGD